MLGETRENGEMVSGFSQVEHVQRDSCGSDTLNDKTGLYFIKTMELLCGNRSTKSMLCCGLNSPTFPRHCIMANSTKTWVGRRRNLHRQLFELLCERCLNFA